MSCRKNALLKITLSYLLTRTLSDSKQKIFDVWSPTYTKKEISKNYYKKKYNNIVFIFLSKDSF